MRDAATIPNLNRTVLVDGSICYCFGDTCIRVRETVEDGKAKLEPLTGDQKAHDEQVELSIDRLHGYCTLLERFLNQETAK